ncbi:COG4315 family predicted lipoprotein [Lysobacter sp. D1-1-M9]|uniref:COG4315 family predicted lipoprotein n=1 Tax=Novilysobacter longmucuonensis TaxID=3098603 RepID=UPI002FC900D0
MSKIPRLALCTAVAALGLVACQQDVDQADTEIAPDAMTPSVEGDLIPPLSDDRRSHDVADTAVDVTHLAVATVGGPAPYLVDSAGHPLYLLEDDRDGSTCTNACLDAWPPLLRSEVPGASAGVDDELIGTVQRADGATQVTYNGHPLYYYAQDPDTGMPTGHDIHDQWGGWYLLTPEGEALHGQES